MARTLHATCPNPLVTCTGCGATVHGCTCGAQHQASVVPACGICTATGGEPDPQAFEAVRRRWRHWRGWQWWERWRR